MKREIRTKGAPQPIGPYSQAVERSGTIFCSGQVGADPTAGTLETGIERQTRRALLNLGSVLKAVGLGLGDVLKTTVFMVDLGQFQQMNEEYARHFASPFPARTTIQVSALPRGALVEIDAVAIKRQR